MASKLGWPELGRKGTNDEKEKHPFYSNFARRQRKILLKQLEQEEKELSSKRRKLIVGIRETTPQED